MDSIFHLIDLLRSTLVTKRSKTLSDQCAARAVLVQELQQEARRQTDLIAQDENRLSELRAVEEQEHALVDEQKARKIARAAAALANQRELEAARERRRTAKIEEAAASIRAIQEEHALKVGKRKQVLEQKRAAQELKESQRLETQNKIIREHREALELTHAQKEEAFVVAQGSPEATEEVQRTARRLQTFEAKQKIAAEHRDAAERQRLRAAERDKRKAAEGPKVKPPTSAHHKRLVVRGVVLKEFPFKDARQPQIRLYIPAKIRATYNEQRETPSNRWVVRIEVTDTRIFVIEDPKGTAEIRVKTGDVSVSSHREKLKHLLRGQHYKAEVERDRIVVFLDQPL